MLEVGTMPRSITIILMDDLVDSCRVDIIIPSDRVGRRRYRDHGRCATEVASALSRCEVRCEHDRGRLVGASDRRRALPYGRVGEEIPDVLESLLQSAMSTLPGAQHSREQRLSQPIRPLSRATQLPSNHHQVKLSLLLILIGGVSSTDPDKNPIHRWRQQYGKEPIASLRQQNRDAKRHYEWAGDHKVLVVTMIED